MWYLHAKLWMMEKCIEKGLGECLVRTNVVNAASSVHTLTYKVKCSEIFLKQA
jgi:hypothetical protein